MKPPAFKKPKSFKKLSGLGKKDKPQPLPDLDSGPGQYSGSDDKLATLTRTLDDEQLAKRIIKLQKEFPNGTLPELIAYDWLKRHNLRFFYQFAVLGGREIRGGQVLDLIVDLGIGILVLEIQGNYFHNRPGMRERDKAERLALLGINILGKKVSYVVEVWESRLIDKHKRDSVMQMALVGVELGM